MDVLLDDLDRVNPLREPQRCDDLMDEARLRIMALAGENAQLRRQAKDRGDILQRVEAEIAAGSHIQSGSAVHLVVLANIVEWDDGEPVQLGRATLSDNRSQNGE